MKINLSENLIYKSLVLLWATLCVVAFIYFPGKFSFIRWSNLGEWQLLAGKLERLELINYITNLLQALAGITIFFLACVSLGILFIRIFKIDSVSSSSTLFAWLALLGTAFLIGHGFFSLIFLTLGSLYKLTRAYVILTLLFGLLAGLGRTKKSLLLPFLKSNFIFTEKPNSRRTQAVLWLSMGILFFTLLYSSARLSYDSSAIYFSDAKLTAMTNHVQYFADDTFVVSVFQTAIQYSALIQVFGDQSARLFSWVCGIVIIIFSIALGEKVGLSTLARFVLLAFILTSTAVLDLMGDGKVDLISSAPAIAAIYWITVGNHNGGTFGKSIYILIGFLMGLAIVARPFNIFLLGIFAGINYSYKAFFEKGFRPFNYRQFIEPVFWIGVGAFGLGIYHLLANWIILGDASGFLSNASKLNLSRWMIALDPNQILVIRLLYPLAATFLNTPQSLGNITPLFLTFLPVILFQDIRKGTTITKELKILLVFSVITLLIWIFLFFAVLEIRYVIFLWVILFMPLSEAVATVLENEDRLFRNILSGLIILLLIFNIWRTVYISLDTYSPIDKVGNPQCYTSRFCQFIEPINETAFPGDRVLTLHAFRYYLRSDLFACSTKHEEYSVLQELSYKDDAAFWLEIYRQGYKYILYENDYATRHLQFGMIPGPENTPDWITLEPIYGKPGDSQVTYGIKVRNPPIKVPSNCQKNPSGIWEVQSITP